MHRVALRQDLEPRVFFQTSSPGVPFLTRPRHAGVYQGEGRQYMVAYATGVPWLEAQEGTAEDLRWRSASVVMQATASMGMPRG